MISTRLHELPNGLRIVTETMPGVASAAVGVWIGAGARHEAPEQNGVAHFLEHMAFKGTRRRTALRIAEEIEDVGGYINAYTSRETTAYYARVLSQDVPVALDVIADILLEPAFEPAEMEVERGVILQEIGQALDTPDDVVFDWLQEVAYADQPMGRTILGPAERVSSFAREDLSRFVSERYGPSEMIVAAAGAVDHDAIVRLSERLFGHLSPRPRVDTDPARFTGGERRVARTLEQAHFALAFEGPGWRDEELYTAQIQATALGGGMSSRLFQEIREKRGLCYTIFAQASAHDDTGLFTVYAGTSESQVAELAELTLDEIRRAADTLTAAEVARARAQMRAGLLMGLESPSARAERLARVVAIWGRVPPVEETLARIDAVTTGDVRALTARMAEEGAGGARALRPDLARARPRTDPRTPGRMTPRGALRWTPAVALRRLRSGSRARVETERLHLRLPEHSDFRAWVALRHGSERFLRPWEPRWADDHLTRRAFTNRVLWARRAVAGGTALPLFMLRREDGALIGAVTLDNVRRGPAQMANLGYWIGEPHARRGYMREAIGGVVRHAFAAMDLSRIEAACLPENAASRGLLESAGFDREGTAQGYLQIAGRWREHVLYARLRSDRGG